VIPSDLTVSSTQTTRPCETRLSPATIAWVFGSRATEALIAARSASAVTGWSLRKIEPSALSAIVSVIGGSVVLCAARGSSISIAWRAIRCAVSMKMISSTSMMSTSGVTLISAMMPRRRDAPPATTPPPRRAPAS